MLTVGGGLAGVIHDVTLAFTDMLLRSTPDADAERNRAFPLIAHGPMRVPDQPFSGSDLPWNETVKRTFFAEEAAVQ